MERINEIEIAKDIVEQLIVQELKNGFDSTNLHLKEFVKMKEEILKNNREIINEVLVGYKSAIKGEM